MTLQDCLIQMKGLIETVIRTATFDGKTTNKKGVPLNGSTASTALIRSKGFINILHEAVKQSIIDNGINQMLIKPPLGTTKPELKLAGLMKQKDQDICIVPSTIQISPRQIDWEPMKCENKQDPYGQKLTEKIVSINVRSQFSSIGKNTDTLQERTFAEAYNLHEKYPKMVLGEVYLIPVYEYNQEEMLENNIVFNPNPVDLTKYISFFHYLNNRTKTGIDYHKYESCALIIVDFNQPIPKIYNTTAELQADNLLPANFSIELGDISFDKLVPRLLDIYQKRFPCTNLK